VRAGGAWVGAVVGVAVRVGAGLGVAVGVAVEVAVGGGVGVDVGGTAGAVVASGAARGSSGRQAPRRAAVAASWMNRRRERVRRVDAVRSLMAASWRVAATSLRRIARLAKSVAAFDRTLRRVYIL
jgi:hypothetical protein